MDLKEVVLKNNKVSGYRKRIIALRDKADRLVQEFADEREICKHELVINFGRNKEDLKGGPYNIYYCLACLTYKAKEIYSYGGPVETFPEEDEEYENNFLFRHSVVLDIRREDNEVISNKEYLPLLKKIQLLLKKSLLLNPDLTLEEFCQLFSNNSKGYTLEIEDNQKVKIR